MKFLTRRLLPPFILALTLGLIPFIPESSELLPSAGKRTTAVHLHLCYVEMAEYFVKYLRMLPDKFDLFVSLPLSDQTEYYETYFRDALANVFRPVRIRAEGDNLAAQIAITLQNRSVVSQ
jgi:lipopolysaccharide biosynthesis protein